MRIDANQSVENPELASIERRIQIMGSTIGLLLLVAISSTISTLVAG